MYVDGGIRSARETLVALALGATAVFLGRFAALRAVGGGPAGVSRLLAELAEDLEEGLRLLGCPEPAALTRDFLADWPSWVARPRPGAGPLRL